jgi:hypothetical protein
LSSTRYTPNPDALNTSEKPGASATQADILATVGGIDLRKEIDSLMTDYGHNVFWRHATNQRCSCWDETRWEGDSNCQFCQGTGWAYRDVLTKSRRMMLTDLVTRTNLKQIAPIGAFGVKQEVFWLRHEQLLENTSGNLVPVTINPSDRDMILEMQLDTDGNLVVPNNIETAWQIMSVHPLRGHAGRIEYWACYVSEHTVGK